MSKIVLFGSACLMGFGLPSLASSQVAWEVTAGADYSSGRYGQADDTRVLYAPVGLRAETDRWRLEVAVPYVNISGPQGSVGGGVVIPGSGAVSSRSGLGDVTLTGAYKLTSGDPDSLALEVGGAVKLPTAAEDLGTGETDYSLGLSARLPVGQRLSLTGSIGYSWLGSPALYTLEDGVTASLGMNYAASTSTNVGVIGSYRAEYFAGLGEQVQLTPFTSFRSAGGWSFTGYGTVGLSNAAPDYGAGIQLGRSF